MLAGGEAIAQSPQVLPGIVVQGATLEPPPRPSRPVPAVEASADVGGQGAPSGAGPGTAGPGETAPGVEAEKIGSAVTVVTRAELERRQIRNGGEALRSLPGVAVNRTGNFAGLSQVRIRGGEANHTLVLIDGIQANGGSDGEYDFSDLLTEDIDRIEVIRGPQSALYGSNAVGGVVNIITRSGKGPFTVTGRAEHGSFRTSDVAARVSGGGEKAWGAVTVHRQTSNGFNISPAGELDENDGSRITSLSGKAGFQLFENVTLGLNVRSTKKELDRDDQTGLASRNGFVVASDSLSRSETSVLLMGAELRWDMLDGALTHLFKASRNVTERGDLSLADFGFGVFPTRFVNTSETNAFAYQATYRLATPMLLAAKHSITGLVEKENESFTPGPDLGDSNERNRSRVGTAGEWRSEFFDRLVVSAGVRHDDNDTLDDHTTWRSSASLRLPEIGMRPHASVGTAVKIPTQFEQFGAAQSFVANPSLRAEESFGWDAGIEFSVLRGRAVLDVTYFEADLEHKIKTEFISMLDPNRITDCRAGELFCSTAINLDGRSRRRGVETALRAELMPGLLLGLAYTYLDAVDQNGNREVRRPPHSGRVDLGYTFDSGRANINLAAIYNGEAKDTVFGAPFFTPVTTTTLDDYWLATLAGSYKLHPGLEIYGRVENLFNQHYEEVFGFNTAGVAAYAGVRITFEERSSSQVGAR
jgi:vitamin B12 transporter